MAEEKKTLVNVRYRFRVDGSDAAYSTSYELGSLVTLGTATSQAYTQNDCRLWLAALYCDSVEIEWTWNDPAIVTQDIKLESLRSQISKAVTTSQETKLADLRSGWGACAFQDVKYELNKRIVSQNADVKTAGYVAQRVGTFTGSQKDLDRAISFLYVIFGVSKKEAIEAVATSNIKPHIS